MIIPIDHKFDLMYSKLASREHQLSRQADFKDHQDFNDVVKLGNQGSASTRLMRMSLKH